MTIRGEPSGPVGPLVNPARAFRAWGAAGA